jgi:hypothetical protein
MNIKITYHLMPWEIDYALLTFTQLKKSKYYISKEVNITIESVLNLSSYIIDWDKSNIPKKFFIEKYNQLSNLLIDYNHIKKIYTGNKLYGHLDLQKECISNEVDYYISICPDMYFSEYLLTYLIEGAKNISDKYFVITPQIYKLWDWTWDEITNPYYIDVDYKKWDEVDIFDIRYNSKFSNNEISLYPTQKSKWAGWFDLYNKKLYEELCPYQEEWKGYGPWDLYSLLITDFVKKQGVNFQQYVLGGETIFEYSVGPLKNGGFSKYYKDLLCLNNIPDQRKEFENKMQKYLNNAFSQLKEKNIL